MAAPRRSGWRSKTPSRAMQARNRSGEWCSTGKSLARRFSPPPSQSVGAGQAVVVERLGQQLAAADVEHERHARPRPGGPRPGRGRRGPARSRPGAPTAPRRRPRRRRALARAARRHAPGRRAGRKPTALRRGSGAQNATMARLSASVPAVEDVEVLAAGEVAQREGREHELGVDPQRVEHAGAHVGVEGAGRHPALRARDHLGADLLLTVRVPQAPGASP